MSFVQLITGHDQHSVICVFLHLVHISIIRYNTKVSRIFQSHFDVITINCKNYYNFSKSKNGMMVFNANAINKQPIKYTTPR